MFKEPHENTYCPQTLEFWRGNFVSWNLTPPPNTNTETTTSTSNVNSSVILRWVWPTASARCFYTGLICGATQRFLLIHRRQLYQEYETNIHLLGDLVIKVFYNVAQSNEEKFSGLDWKLFYCRIARRCAIPDSREVPRLSRFGSWDE